MLRAVLLFIVSASLVASAQTRDTRTWYQAYRDAQTKIQQRNWQGALNDLDAASRAGAPRPARNINFYGDVYDTYNPDYYRGVALFNLQRYAEADQAFERVRAAQLINARDATYAGFVQLAQNVKDNMQRLAAAQPAPPSAPTNVRVLPGDQAPAPTGQLQQPPTALPPSAVASAQPGPGAGGPNPAVASPADVGGSGVAAAQPAPTVAPPPVGYTAAVDATTRQPPPPRSGPVPAATAAAAITRSAASAKEEQAGMFAFFSGDYANAAVRLSALVDAGTAGPRTYLYLACSQIALELTGQSNGSAGSARPIVARIGDLSPFARDLQLISPRIRQQLGLQP